MILGFFKDLYFFIKDTTLELGLKFTYNDEVCTILTKDELVLTIFPISNVDLPIWPFIVALIKQYSKLSFAWLTDAISTSTCASSCFSIEINSSSFSLLTSCFLTKGLYLLTFEIARFKEACVFFRFAFF